MNKLLALLLLVSTYVLNGQSYFSPLTKQDIQQKENVSPRAWQPNTYSVWQANLQSLSEMLATAPMEDTYAARHNNTAIVEVPMPDGSVEAYEIIRVMTCEQAIYDNHPEIRTFAGTSLSNPAHTIRGSVTIRGFRAMVFDENKRPIFVEPYSDGQTEYYISYAWSDVPAHLIPAGPSRGVVENAPNNNPSSIDHTVQLPVAGSRNSAELVERKTYRYAACCTGEFGQDHGGTAETAFAAIVEYTNWINGIYERDMALRLQLIAGCEAVAFFNPATDPFENIDPLALLGQNSFVLNGFLSPLGGQNAYDIGHVYARFPGGGILGVAGAIGNACVAGNKAQGCSTGFQGVYGGNFINTLGQELGHQMGGGHTWNRCGGGNGRNSQSSFEPGSGSTIMSYAGACGSDNIQSDSDLYFHSGSAEEILRYVTYFNGATCGTFTETTNHIPEVDFTYSDGFYIPILTPFELNGFGTDADGDPVLFGWEEMDLGPETPLNFPVSTSPLFRTFPPSDKTNRYFPRLPLTLSNQFNLTEQLPTYTRDLTFRLSGRDNLTINGGISWKDVEFGATELAGPFIVTNPNATGIEWKVGEYVSVTWDVANTFNAPVNCKKVNIRLSTDAGQTWPYTLATGITNDGEHTILVPDMISNAARIRVDAADNVFFNVSNSNFKIVAPTTPSFSVGIAENTTALCLPNNFETNIFTSALLGFNQPVSIEIVPGNLPAEAVVTLGSATIQAGQSTSLSVDLSQVGSGGTFEFSVSVSAQGVTPTVIPITIYASANDFSAMALQSPADGSVNMAQSQVLHWSKADDAVSYDLQFGTSPSFESNTILATKTATTVDSFAIPFLLEKNKAYFWRIRPNNICSPHAWTEPFFFATLTENCSSYSAFDLPKNIASNSVNTIESKVNVLISAQATDVNVEKIKGYHGYFSDLEVSLEGPAGQNVLLFKSKCNNYDGAYNLGFDDSSPVVFSCPPNSGANGGFVKPQNSLSVFSGLDAQGAWTLKVKDNSIGAGGSLDEFSVNICQAVSLNPPFVERNNILPVDNGNNALIDNNLLLINDANNTASQLRFTLITAPKYGFANLDGVGQLQAGSQFTQEDINNGKLRYYNYGWGLHADYFRFMVTDGEGGYIGNLTFTMEVAVSANEAIRKTPEFTLAPNPAQGNTSLTFSEPLLRQASLVVFDAAGRAIQSRVIERGTQRFAVSTQGLSEGVYFIQLSTNEGIIVKKLIVQW